MKFLLLMAMFVSVLAACKKDDDVQPGITGHWEGKWAFGNDAPEYEESWDINQNGTIKAYDEDGDLYAEGTWDLDGTAFTMQYLSGAYNEYSFSGTYNEASLEMHGTWGGTPSDTDGGHFEMAKKN